MSASTMIFEEHTTIPEMVEQIAQMGGGMTLENLSFEYFSFLTRKYPELRIEQESNGNITIMAPIAGFGGTREGLLTGNLLIWKKSVKKGQIFSPSTGFRLPDGSTKSPDASWITEEKFQQLARQTNEKGFLKTVPDFVVELISESDRINKAKQKMTDTWIANGVKLAWLIDPYKEVAFIYREDGTIEKVTGFDNKLSGETVLPDFELDLAEFRLIGGR